MNKVLVTGATGFIGCHLIKHLLNNSTQVRILTRNKTNTHFFTQTQIMTGDLTIAESLNGLCSDIDTVFHLGGYAHAWAEGNSQFADRHHVTNFLGTQNILDEAIRSNVKRFIFISSVKAVGESDTCIDESWNQPPTSPYGIAKRKAETLVLASKDNTDMHVSILRLPIVYGPQWKGNLASMLRAIDRGLFPRLPNTRNRRSMVSVDDVCRAAITAANHPKADGNVYYVTDQIDYSSAIIYSLMRQALGKSPSKWYIPLWAFKCLALAGDIGSSILKRRMPFNSDSMTKLFGSASYSSQRIQQDLGFKPADTLEKMLPRIIDAYKNGN